MIRVIMLIPMVAILFACGLVTRDENPSATDETSVAQVETPLPSPIIRAAATPVASALAPSPPPVAAPSPRGAPDLAALSLEECWDRFKLRPPMKVTVPGSGSDAVLGTGLLEQLVLEHELAVRAEVVGVEWKVVEIETAKFAWRADPTTYDKHKYTVLREVELLVHEYLKGEGPDTISAVVESEVAFNSTEATSCAERVLEEEVRSWGVDIGDEGLGLLDSTGYPDLYYLARGSAIFPEGDRGLGHSTWLPYKDGSIYNRSEDRNFYGWSSDGWISLAEARQRVSTVLKEYGSRDDERWRRCVVDKYFFKGRDPWVRHRGVGSYDNYRDHRIIFDGEHVPVPAGTTVWVSPRSGYYTDDAGNRITVSFIMDLEGKDADLFQAAHLTEYLYFPNEWVGRSGSSGAASYLAIWHRPRPGELKQTAYTTEAWVITTARELTEGEYSFTLLLETVVEGQERIDCGQGGPEPRKFDVIVDSDGDVER